MPTSPRRCPRITSSAITPKRPRLPASRRRLAGRPIPRTRSPSPIRFNDRPLHRRRPRRSRPDHGARARPDPRCPVCLYAGSLVPREVVAEAPEGARVATRRRCDLDEIVAEMADAHARGQDVARRAFGRSVALWRHRRAGAPAGRARDPLDHHAGRAGFRGRRGDARVELTLPGVCQSVVLTRTAVRASAMPEGEELAAFAADRGHAGDPSLDQQPSAGRAGSWRRCCGEDCPVAVVYRASWPDELILRGTLATIREKVKAAGITRTALILVGRALAPDGYRGQPPLRARPPSRPAAEDPVEPGEARCPPRPSPSRCRPRAEAR